MLHSPLSRGNALLTRFRAVLVHGPAVRSCTSSASLQSEPAILEPANSKPAALPTALNAVRWHVDSSEDGSRLDRFIKRRAPGLPAGFIQKNIRYRRVIVNSEPAIKHATMLRTGDIVKLPGDIKLGLTRGKKKPKDNDVSLAEAETVRYWVLHRDARCIVLNKPPGLPVLADDQRCLENLLCGLGAGRYWLVHQLDKDISGAIVVARDVGAAGLLCEAFRSRSVSRKFWALVKGRVDGKQGTINSNIDGKMAVTRWRVMQRLDNHCTWLELEPRTGRKDQLRIHCAHALSAPILGDTTFGPQMTSDDIHFYSGLHLVSKHISFPKLTAVGKRAKKNKRLTTVSVNAPLPPHMLDSWKRFGLNQNLIEY